METYNKTMTHTSVIPTHPEQRSWGSTLGHILPWIPRFMILAHLSPGSLQVAEGEIVKEGQGIGQCGNSGNTSEPHIHIHHQPQDPYLYPLVFAEDLPLYFRDQEGDPMPQGGSQIENGKVIWTWATMQHTGK